MKKTIRIINIILIALLLLLEYIPICIAREGMWINDYWYDGQYFSYGGYMDEDGWIAIGAIAILLILSFTKYYFATIAPAIINLFVIIYEYFYIQSAETLYFTDHFVVLLVIIVAVCIVLNSIWAIANCIYEKILKSRKTSEVAIKQEVPQSNADELKKFKDLLDSGIITQEEFDEKKKQLLGL